MTDPTASAKLASPPRSGRAGSAVAAAAALVLVGGVAMLGAQACTQNPEKGTNVKGPVAKDPTPPPQPEKPPEPPPQPEKDYPPPAT
jgi:hypothetical protein